jgi:RNA polymerase sigma-70 factor (ECF subfamily)
VTPDDRRPPIDPVPGDVVARLRVGDDAVFEQVFRAYYTALCGFAFRFLKNAERAEDRAQDVFGALWDARATLEIHSSLKAYLFAAVRNRALNLRKRDGVVEQWEHDEANEDVRVLHPRPEQPDALFDRNQLEAELAAAIDALPERCALAMRLRWRDQMSHAEIAESLGISIKGVERLLARGLQGMRVRLGERM